MRSKAVTLLCWTFFVWLSAFSSPVAGGEYYHEDGSYVGGGCCGDRYYGYRGLYSYPNPGWYSSGCCYRDRGVVGYPYYRRSYYRGYYHRPYYGCGQLRIADGRGGWVWGPGIVCY